LVVIAVVALSSEIAVDESNVEMRSLAQLEPGDLLPNLPRLA
jgi:hypothetical protein